MLVQNQLHTCPLIRQFPSIDYKDKHRHRKGVANELDTSENTGYLMNATPHPYKRQVPNTNTSKISIEGAHTERNTSSLSRNKQDTCIWLCKATCPTRWEGVRRKGRLTWHAAIDVNASSKLRWSGFLIERIGIQCVIIVLWQALPNKERREGEWAVLGQQDVNRHARKTQDLQRSRMLSCLLNNRTNRPQAHVHKCLNGNVRWQLKRNQCTLTNQTHAPNRVRRTSRHRQLFKVPLTSKDSTECITGFVCCGKLTLSRQARCVITASVLAWAPTHPSNLPAATTAGSSYTRLTCPQLVGPLLRRELSFNGWGEDIYGKRGRESEK